MEVGLLGPVTATVGGRSLALRGPRQRRLIAALAAASPRAVSLERLGDVVWPHDPPATARRQIQDLASSMRVAIAAAGGRPDAIIAHAGAYRLVADVDAVAFRDLVAEARRALGTDPEEAAARLRAARALWRGEALAGLDCPALEPERLALEEARLDAAELSVEAEIAAGRAGGVLDELTGLVAAHPARERLVVHLMRALHRVGRTADALAAYRRLRRHLAEELGIDPGAEVNEEYTALLRAGGAMRPAQLPPDPAGFTGRAADLRRLDEFAAGGGRLVAVVGPGGVGKTALALHWARRAADALPDGVLHADLRGWSGAGPADPVAVLGRFLRALGHPVAPVDVDEASALFRTVMAERRMLVLLDNVAGAAQVRPLLPAGGSLVVVTSRDELSGLVVHDGARRLRLGMLDPTEAVAMLRATVGPAMIDADPPAAARLAVLCGGLPLALRIAAAQLAGPPGSGIAGYVAEMERRDRLSMLEIAGDEGQGVRAVLDRSFAVLDPAEQGLFRLAGAAPGTDLTVESVAALAGTDGDTARARLERLVSATLVQRAAGGRYQLHDLLRLYARRLGPGPDPEALRRLYDMWLAGADAAARRLHPNRLRLRGITASPDCFASDADALRWLDDERDNLLDAVRHPAAPPAYTWRIIDALRGYLPMRPGLADALDAATAATAAAERAGDHDGACIGELAVAEIIGQGGDEPAVEPHMLRALHHAERGGWRAGQRAAHINVGGSFLDRVRLADAEYHLARAAELAEPGPMAFAAAYTYGCCLGVLGRLEEAARQLDDAVAMTGDHHLRETAAVLASLAEVRRQLGHLDAARRHLTRALEIDRELRYPPGEAESLTCLSVIHRDEGRLDEAYDCASRAAALATTSGDVRVGAYATAVTATVLTATGRHRDAVTLLEPPPSPVNVGPIVIDPRVALAEAYLAADDPPAARRPAEAALAYAVEVGAPLLLASAATALAAVRRAQGDGDAAAELTATARAVYRRSGHRAGRQPRQTGAR